MSAIQDALREKIERTREKFYFGTQTMPDGRVYPVNAPESMWHWDTPDLLNLLNLGQIEQSVSRSVKKPPTLDGLKKSVQKIKAEPFDAKARSRIETKIQRLHKVGADAQAAILERQIMVRESLLRLQEWDYKLLPLKAIESFVAKNNNWDGNRGKVIIHIDDIEKYQGNPQAGEAKDRIIPDNVLDKVEEAEERQLFDDYAVLWAENIPDPLLLGKIDDCEDYFLITEWGNDITFEQLMKGE